MSHQLLVHEKRLYGIGQGQDSPRKTERSFSSPLDEGFYCLVCAILEQAVIDWRFLGEGEKVSERVDTQYIYSREVEKFLTSEWFEELLAYALPEYTAQEIREQLNVKEPIRRDTVDKTRKRAC